MLSGLWQHDMHHIIDQIHISGEAQDQLECDSTLKPDTLLKRESKRTGIKAMVESESDNAINVRHDMPAN